MAYKQFPTDKYIAEIKRKANIQSFESPIIRKFNTELRAKIKPTITELPPTASENDIRSALTTELSKVLKSSDVPNVIENLSKANDLRSFYRFSKTFLNQIKDIRNLDASFFLDLWSKFKSQMLSSVGFSKLEIQSEREGEALGHPPFQGERAIGPTGFFEHHQTAAEYEQSQNRLKSHKQSLVSQIREQQAKANALNRQKVPLSISVPGDVLSYRSQHESDPFLGKHYNPARHVENMLETLPYGYQTTKFKKKGPGGTSEFTKIPRKGPANHFKGAAIVGERATGPIGFFEHRQTYLSRR